MAKTSKKQTTKKASTKKTLEAKTKTLFSAVQTRYPHVRSIAAVGDSGKPTRVIIGCTADGCKETREIATQDAFQVSRCPACQRAYAKLARRKTKVEAKPKSPKVRARKTQVRRQAGKARKQMRKAAQAVA